MQNPKPEKLILKIPKWLWKSKRLAFCMPRNQAISSLLILMGIAVFLGLYSYYGRIHFLINVLLIASLVFGFSLVALGLLPTIFIRKDCFECQFGFHIIAHERNHLRLRTSEEIVEEEALKQTGDRLIPILLSNPKICKGCPFLWRKMYCHATFNYLKIK